MICGFLRAINEYRVIITRKETYAAGARLLSRSRDVQCSSNELEDTPVFSEKLKFGPDLKHFIKFNRVSKNVNVESSNDISGERSIEILRKQLEISRKHMNKRSVLIDSHNRFHNYLRISLTERCNLRCTYCMPENGVDLTPSEKLLSTEEVVKVAKLFVSYGVNKIRLTGGEPTIRRDLVDIVEQIHGLGVTHIGITTNGINLTSKIKELRKSGLSHVNISLDTLQEKKFSLVTRRKGLTQVLKSIDAAIDEGYEGKLKINCVVMNGFNDDELKDFAKMGATRHVDVRFIEWMPFTLNGWDQKKFYSFKSMMHQLELEGYALQETENDKNDTTKWFRVPGHLGRIGFITSMSEHFCGTCNRLRVLADGTLKVCLFDGNESLSLRDAMRYGFTDEELSLLVHSALLQKKDVLGGHGDMLTISKSKNRPMILIGG